MPVSKTPKKGFTKRADGLWHMPYKGERRLHTTAGSRKAFDATKDSRKRASAAAKRKKGVTTKKGMARVGTVAGARLAFDSTPDWNMHRQPI